jgi:AAA domain/UvrD-like helicase C-terminal domain
MFHLTMRVAWHDAKWDGSICAKPSCNSFCSALDRIREEKDDAYEDARAGQSWSDLNPDELPPCKAESGAFMNAAPWRRRFIHPYSSSQKTAETHGILKPTIVEVPEYSAFAVPFAWMLLGEQKSIDEKLPNPLAPDEKSPFHSAWVFGRERQSELIDLFFDRLTPKRSLVFFYCKEGQPVDETISRLIVGVGQIQNVIPTKQYDVADGKPTYPMWDRLVRHSIRPDGVEGFIFPYHEYLEPTGDAEEDERNRNLLEEIAVAAEAAHTRMFSYGAELADSDVALSTLVRCLDAARKIREHGIAKGPWERREEWLNAQINLAWKDRGAFPGLGAALEAVGMRLGTALSLELLATGALKPEDDPWPIVDALIRGNISPPQDAYVSDLKAIQETWINLSNERKALLALLSRMSLTPNQATRWFDLKIRNRATSSHVTDIEIIENPYRISETDLGDSKDQPIPIGMIDRGMLPDSTVAAKHPLPEPSNIGSQNDPRRLRAALVEVLRSSATNGDALLSLEETLDRVARLDLSHPSHIGSDWPSANRAAFVDVIEMLEIPSKDAEKGPMPALQLSDFMKRENRLSSLMTKRAKRETGTNDADWEALLVKAIENSGRTYDPKNTRHASAIKEQAAALTKLTSRRLSALVGRAGTGKTSVMGALLLNSDLADEGILLLAPTGKARVRLGKAARGEAKTVAQFLNELGRYDGQRQMPKFTGAEKYRKERTVVIDECSMLTMDDLLAILLALDLAHVRRIILVGDPNQLPPIGVGRPFADFVSFLEDTADDETLTGALARLTVEVRTASGAEEASDTLRLASWFTKEPQPVDADRVISDLELGKTFNDLDLRFWETADELHVRLGDAFQEHLGLKNPYDVEGFNSSLGFDEKGWVPFEDPDGSENWQILSPVRLHPHGVHDINRWTQRRYRSSELKKAEEPWVTSLGDERIVIRDKVIQVANQRRQAYDGSSSEHYVANGEVALIGGGKGKFLNALFAGRPNLRFGYSRRDFPGGTGPLELAYAITVHKSQGSEFQTVFVILPKNCRPLSRELMYTAMTRSKQKLVILIEGNDASMLFDYSRPERSETARRNTNLFRPVLRSTEASIPYAENLIHTTNKGHSVRSKSELVIANMLFDGDLEYEYERVLEGEATPGRLRPDFSFVTDEGDLIIWEHLGMMHRAEYREGWEWKLGWYNDNGFILGENLFISKDDRMGGLHSDELRKTVEYIRDQMSF